MHTLQSIQMDFRIEHHVLQIRKSSSEISARLTNKHKNLFDITKSGYHFLNHTRAYNNVLALASLGCNEIVALGYSPTFKIQGKLYHRIGSLLPSNSDGIPKFAQPYSQITQMEFLNFHSLTFITQVMNFRTDYTMHNYNLEHCKSFKNNCTHATFTSEVISLQLS